MGITGKTKAESVNLTIILTAAILFILPFQSFAADSYNYDLPDFQKIEVSGSMTAVLEKRSKPGLYIELENSSIDDLTWYVSVKTLVLKKKSEFPDFRDVKIVVYYSDEITSVLSKNRAVVKNIRKIEADSIIIEAVSAGIADLRIEADRIEARSVRTSRLKLTGKCRKLYVQADSGSEVDSLAMPSDMVQAFAHSGGIIRVNALESIGGSSGLGSFIYYKGSPRKKVFTSGTGGEVKDISQ